MPAKTKRKAKPGAKRKYRGLTRLDPTRSVTLRRAFAATLRKQFARLKAAILLLINKEDAFGLKADARAGEQVANWCNQYGGDTCRVGGAPPPRAESNAKVGKIISDGLKAAAGIPRAQRDVYAKTISEVINRMPDEAVARAAANLQAVNFYGDLKALGLSASIEDNRVREQITDGRVQIGGYYRKSDRALALDGDSRKSSAADLYAHELTHAIDGPDYEISSGREWGEAFAAELSGGQLTKYATTKASEGLAEFGRFLYSGNRQEEIRTRFPRCWAVFEARGLLPRSAPARPTRNAAPAPFPDIFDYPAPMADGGDADVLLPAMSANANPEGCNQHTGPGCSASEDVPKVISDIKGQIEIQASMFKRSVESGKYGDNGREMLSKDPELKQFKKNWKKTLKGLDADPTVVERVKDSIKAAYKGRELPHVPIFVRKLTADEQAGGENAHWDNGFMVISDDAFNDERYRSSIKGLSDRKFTVKEAYPDLVSGLIIHELGHKFHDDNSEALRTAERILYVEGLRREVNDRISSYAESHPRELVAEAYAMSHHRDFHSLPEETRALVNRVLGRNNTPTANTRWRFATSPEKLKEFQKWLREQFGSQVAGKGQRELWQKFIEEGFRKGAGRSFDDVRQSRLRAERPELFTPARQGSVGDFYQGSRDEFLRSSFARPETVEKVQLLAERVYSDLDGITEEMGTRMSRTLAEGLTRGQHPNEIARALADEVDIGRNRAETIARTEITRAHAEGQLDSFKALGVEEVGVAVEWATANDDKVCPKCQSLEGVVLKIDEARGLLPRHPNCLLPGNFVQGRFLSALKAGYAGEAIELVTDQGARLTLTVNHPVLTEYGFVCAGEVKQGHYLACYLGKAQPTVDSDVEKAPTKVEELFDSFPTLLVQKPVLGFDFNGDEEFMVGEVDVVLPDLPAAELFTDKAESEQQVGFVPADDGCVGSLGLSQSLGVGHPAPLDGFGLALGSRANAVSQEPSVHAAPVDAEGFGQLVGRFSGEVPAAKFGVVDPDPIRFQCIGFGSDLDVSLPEPVKECVTFDSDLFGQLVRRFPRQVALCKVVEVRRFHYSGPVYDLETTVGYFIGSKDERGGIIIKNCRCAFLPANVGEVSDAQTRSQAGVEEALEESGIDDVSVDSDRPESILNSEQLSLAAEFQKQAMAVAERQW